MSIDFIENTPNYITAVVAVVGVVIAGIGLTTWKQQLKGTSEYELAKKLMLDIYKVRDALQSARHPFLSVSEGEKDDTEDTWEITAYSRRWERVRESLTAFDLSSLEAEVVWDEKTKNLKKDLLHHVNELNFAIGMFIRQKRDPSFSDDFHKNFADKLYDVDGKDDYSVSLDVVIKSYEKVLKPYLKK